jgi:aubergine-like protein
MVCGIDVYHPGNNETLKGNVAAFIASMDQMLTSWHSRVCKQIVHQELVDLLKQCLISAIKTYREVNFKYIFHNINFVNSFLL